MTRTRSRRRFRIPAEQQQSQGVRLVDMYVSSNGALVGAARVARESLDRARDKTSAEVVRRVRARQDQRRKAYEAQLAAERASFMADFQELEALMPENSTDESASRLAELKHRKQI